MRPEELAMLINGMELSQSALGKAATYTLDCFQ